MRRAWALRDGEPLRLVSCFHSRLDLSAERLDNATGRSLGARGGPWKPSLVIKGPARVTTAYITTVKNVFGRSETPSHGFVRPGWAYRWAHERALHSGRAGESSAPGEPPAQ
jgi:hypothetical protein